MVYNPDRKSLAISALGKAMLSDSSLRVRLTAIESLAKIRDEAAIPYLIKALDDPDPQIRERITEALGIIYSSMPEVSQPQNVLVFVKTLLSAYLELELLYTLAFVV